MNRTIRVVTWIVSLVSVGLWLLAALLASPAATSIISPQSASFASVPIFVAGIALALFTCALATVYAWRGHQWTWFGMLVFAEGALITLPALALAVTSTAPAGQMLAAAVPPATLIAPMFALLFVRVSGEPCPNPGLTRIEELRKPAAWDRLSETERTELVKSYAPPESFARLGAKGEPFDRPFLIDHYTERDVLRWVANLIGEHFQPEARSVIQHWLDDASPNAHLVVPGSYGFGMTSLLVSLACESMAKRPQPAEYCTVPDPEALLRGQLKQHLLVLRPGTAEPFAQALRAALIHVCVAWQLPSVSDEQAEPGPSDLMREIAGYLAQVAGLANRDETLLEYLNALVDALFRLANEGLLPAVCDSPVVVERIGACPEGALWNLTEAGHCDAGFGAPVILYSQGRAGLDNIREALLCANGGVLIIALEDAPGLSDQDAQLLNDALRRGHRTRRRFAVSAAERTRRHDRTLRVAQGNARSIL